MLGSLSWRNLSVKHKLFSLVLLPVVLLLFLAGQQVYRLSNQSQELKRAQLYSDYMDKLSYLYHLPYQDNITNKHSETQKLIKDLNTKAGAISPDNRTELTGSVIIY